MSILAEEPASEGAPDWMVSYADMITILMSFFAVMFSMAMSKDKKKDAPMINSLHRQFGAILQMGYRNQDPLGDSAHDSTRPSAGQATIGGVIYFDSETSGLNDEQREQLQALAKVLGGKSWKIEILARTLAQPPDTDDILGKNWNLARARCNSTMRYLVLLGIDPTRIRVGVAARFGPIRAGGDAVALKNDDSVEVFTLNEFAENARAEPTDRARD